MNEPSELYQHLLVDTLMYAKHKIMSGFDVDGGVGDLLRKVKAGLLKVL